MTGDRDRGAGEWVTQLTDEQLLNELARVLRSVEPVPPQVIAAGQAAWTWRTVDAELAELIQDSALDDAAALALRSGSPEEAVLRWLTFAASGVSIELEITADAVLGQLVPAQPATVTVERCWTGGCPGDPGSQQPGGQQPGGQQPGGQQPGGQQIVVDDVGWFRLGPVPQERFRLRCRTAAGQTVVTAWISL